MHEHVPGRELLVHQPPGVYPPQCCGELRGQRGEGGQPQRPPLQKLIERNTAEIFGDEESERAGAQQVERALNTRHIE